jgi:proteasome assembly chaperone 3
MEVPLSSGQSPIRTVQASISVSGSPATVLLSVFSDRVLVIVSQLDTFGTLVHAQRNSVLGGQATYATSTLLGMRDDMLPEVVARRLAERLYEAGIELPLLLSFGLKKRRDQSSATDVQSILKEVVDGVMESLDAPRERRQNKDSVPAS